MKKIKYYLREILSTFIIIIIFANIVSFYRSLDLYKDTFPLDNISFNDKPLMIHFWATWCPICKVEAPNIQKISKEYNVVTIASQSGTDKDIKKYMKQNNINFTFVNDYDNNYAKKFNITVFPTTLIYDKDKNLVFSEIGYTSTIGLYLRMWWASL